MLSLGFGNGWITEEEIEEKNKNKNQGGFVWRIVSN